MGSAIFHVARCLLLWLSVFLSTKGEMNICPDIPTKDDFDLRKMVGVWNEIIILPNQWEFGRCIRMTVSQIDEKGQASIRWEQITSNSTISFALSHVTANNGSSASKMSLFFTQPYIPWPSPFWILGTDYVNFALIYSCSEVYDEITNSTVTSELAWIMARKREMSQGQKALFKLYLSINGIDVNSLIDVDQSSCDPYDLE